MKKIFLLSIAAIALSLFFMCSSCKKTSHPNNPTPGNFRILSYDRISNLNTIDDKYTFTYDANNRVSLITYSTNDPALVSAGLIGERIAFRYSGDSIYKSIYNVASNKLMENDTFVLNGAGQLVAAYNPGSTFTYQYYGNLLSGETDTYRDSGTTITAVKTYTSDNGDFLSRNFNGVLTATFSDTGFKSTAVVADTDFSAPFSAIWDVTYPQPTTTPIVPVEHDGLYGFTDKLSYSKGGPVVLTAEDGNGVSTRAACVYPGDLWPAETFTVWPNLTNRAGDYLQLSSFTTYGVNIYQNAHLVMSITNPGRVTNLTYTIDGDSKITQTVAIATDSLKQTTYVTYNIQYATYGL